MYFFIENSLVGVWYFLILKFLYFLFLKFDIYIFYISFENIKFLCFFEILLIFENLIIFGIFVFLWNFTFIIFLFFENKKLYFGYW